MNITLRYLIEVIRDCILILYDKMVNSAWLITKCIRDEFFFIHYGERKKIRLGKIRHGYS